MISAFVGLAQFRQANYKFSPKEPIIFKEQLTRVGLDENNYQSLATESLEKEYEKIKQKLDIDHWMNVPGPKPGEDSKKKQEEFRKGVQQK